MTNSLERKNKIGMDGVKHIIFKDGYRREYIYSGIYGILVPNSYIYSDYIILLVLKVFDLSLVYFYIPANNFLFHKENCMTNLS